MNWLQLPEGGYADARRHLDASQRAMIAAKLAGSSFTIPLLDRGSLLWRGLVGLRYGLPFRRQHVEA